MAVDLDAAEAELAAPHVIDLREDGFTIRHPMSCRPTLFDCPIWQAARRGLTEPPDEPGRYTCDLDPDGSFLLGEAASDDEPVDWAGVVAELRAAREKLAFVYEQLAQDGYEPAGPMPARIREALAAKRGEGG